MKLRTFTASDMPAAMKMVRDALGENAVILSSSTDKAKRQVKVTAAIEPEAPRTSFEDYKVTVEHAQRRHQRLEWAQQLDEILQFHNVPTFVSRRLQQVAQEVDLEPLLVMQKLASSVSGEAIESRVLGLIIEKAFKFSPLPLNSPGAHLMLMGPPGIGKTLTIAKLATQLAMHKRAVNVITTDTKRAGGIEQLSAFTDILKLTLHVAEDNKSLAEFVRGSHKNATVLVDTAGCNPYDKKELDILKQYSVIPNLEPVLVMPGGMDSAEAADMAALFAFPGVKRLIITRMDTTRRLGGALAAAEKAKLAFADASDSARVVGEMKTLTPTLLAQQLLQYKKDMR